MRFVPSIAGRMAVFATATLFLSASASFAAGDPAAGQHVFAKCAACHSTSPGVNKLGPSLAGVVGRKSGTAAGDSYFPPMTSANLTRGAAPLHKILANPPG